MKILLISPYFSPAVGGVETHLDDFCKYLASKEHSVFVRTYLAFGVKNRGQVSDNTKYLKIHRLPWPDFNLIFTLEKFPLLKFIYLFIGLFLDCFFFLLSNKSQIDVIQSHGFIAGLIGVILGKIFNKRVVINTHVGFNLSSGFMTKLIKLTLRQADEVLVLTNGVKKSLIALGIPENKIVVYHYWVDQKVFKKQSGAKKQLNWKDKFIVLFVGRLIEVKGVNSIIRLARDLKNITFVIAGSGPLSENLQNESQKYENIIFLGKIDNSKLPLYYSAGDLLLVPSRVIKQEYEEGIPRVIVEALSCALPIISTKSGAIPDVFSSEIGELVNDNITDIKIAIMKLYKNKKQLNDFSLNSRKYALDNFGPENADIILKSLK